MTGGAGDDPSSAGLLQAALPPPAAREIPWSSSNGVVSVSLRACSLWLWYLWFVYRAFKSAITTTAADTNEHQQRSTKTRNGLFIGSPCSLCGLRLRTKHYKIKHLSTKRCGKTASKVPPCRRAAVRAAAKRRRSYLLYLT